MRKRRQSVFIISCPLCGQPCDLRSLRNNVQNVGQFGRFFTFTRKGKRGGFLLFLLLTASFLLLSLWNLKTGELSCDNENNDFVGHPIKSSLNSRESSLNSSHSHSHANSANRMRNIFDDSSTFKEQDGQEVYDESYEFWEEGSGLGPVFFIPPLPYSHLDLELDLDINALPDMKKGLMKLGDVGIGSTLLSLMKTEHFGAGFVGFVQVGQPEECDP